MGWPACLCWVVVMVLGWWCWVVVGWGGYNRMVMKLLKSLLDVFGDLINLDLVG